MYEKHDTYISEHMHPLFDLKHVIMTFSDNSSGDNITMMTSSVSGQLRYIVIEISI